VPGQSLPYGELVRTGTSEWGDWHLRLRKRTLSDREPKNGRRDCKPATPYHECSLVPYPGDTQSTQSVFAIKSYTHASLEIHQHCHMTGNDMIYAR